GAQVFHGLLELALDFLDALLQFLALDELRQLQLDRADLFLGGERSELVNELLDLLVRCETSKGTLQILERFLLGPQIIVNRRFPSEILAGAIQAGHERRPENCDGYHREHKVSEPP